MWRLHEEVSRYAIPLREGVAFTGDIQILYFSRLERIRADGRIV